MRVRKSKSKISTGEHGNLRVRISDKEQDSHYFDVYVDELEDSFDRLSFEVIE